MHSFPFAILVLTMRTMVSSDVCNDCTPRRSIDMHFPDIDGVYYLMLYLNETRMEQRSSCIKITFKTDPNNNTVYETVEVIPGGSEQVTRTHLTSYYRSPGIVENNQVTTNGTELYFLDYIMEFTLGESLIASVCQKNDGKIQNDKISVFFTTRNVSPDVILAKLRSVGITGSEPNTDYFFVPQLMCPN